MNTDNIIYTFTGVVHPERADVTIMLPIQKFTIHNESLSGDIALSIQRSQVSVVVKTTSLVENINALKNGVRDFVKSVVDLLGFFLGCGYDVEIIQVVDNQDCKQIVFGVDIPALSEYRNKLNVDRKKRFEEYFQLTTTEAGMFLRRAFNDLSSSVKSPIDTGFYCYRAIETIKQYFGTTVDYKDDRKIWEKMRSDLNIERSDIDYVKHFADLTRHGAYTNLNLSTLSVSGIDRDKMLKIAWHIIFSFMEHIKSE